MFSPMFSVPVSQFLSQSVSGQSGQKFLYSLCDPPHLYTHRVNALTLYLHVLHALTHYKHYVLSIVDPYTQYSA